MPQLFIATGADKWGDHKHFPWTMGWQPSYRIEAQIYAKHILAEKPDAKIAILYQNDDFGKDYLAGVKDVLGDKFDKSGQDRLLRGDGPDRRQQAVSLQSSGADVLITAATPKFAAQTIRKVADLDWKPLHLPDQRVDFRRLRDRARRARSGHRDRDRDLFKDPATRPGRRIPGCRRGATFFKKYIAGGDVNDSGYRIRVRRQHDADQVLKQCGDDLSRENIMKQAANLHELEIPTLLPGITVNTARPTSTRSGRCSSRGGTEKPGSSSAT